MNTLAINNKITLGTRGKLVSTTDMNWARRLGRRVSIRSLLNSNPGHYELTDDSVIVYAFGEMFELELS